jgi:carnitine O-acetyltransferase
MTSDKEEGFERVVPDMQASFLTLDSALQDETKSSDIEPGINFSKQDDLPRLPIQRLAPDMQASFLTLESALQDETKSSDIEADITFATQDELPRLPIHMQASFLTLDSALQDETRSSDIELGITFAKQDEIPRLPIQRGAADMQASLFTLESASQEEGRRSDIEPGNTFAKQDELPRLPIQRVAPDMQASFFTLESALQEETRSSDIEPDITFAKQDDFHRLPIQRGASDMHTSFLTLDSALQEETKSSDIEQRITFAKQDELPRLPIPALEDTLDKFLQCLEAIQTEDEKVEAQQVVLEFIKMGDGPKLQELLLEYEREGTKDGIMGSYIEEFWNESYLVPDQSVVLNLNPFFVLEDGPDPKTARDPIRRAASLCFAAVKLASTVREETLLPDIFKENPLCMDQYKGVFGAARVPHLSGDDIDVYPHSSHVVVMSRNQLYYFQAMWPDGFVAVDEEDIVEILHAIDKNSRQANPAETARKSLGVLTSLGRRQWAKLRAEISGIGNNEQYLTIVDSGLFVLVLDDVIPKSVDEAASNMLHGTYQIENSGDPEYPGSQMGSSCNRWYDKLQIIVCGDGTAGINFERSTIDGHTALRIVSDIYAETVVNFAQSITKTIPAHGKIPHVIDAVVYRAGTHTEDNCDNGDNGVRDSLDVLPKKISFSIPEKLQKELFHAETALGDEIISSDTRVLEFQDYGKKLIVASNFSPDAYVQMSMMLAYYKVYGQMVCVYEPVLTKSFFHGRTEAMRSATLHAKDLCQTFFDPAATAQRKLTALRRAITVHTNYVRECAGGHGVDRHLFALKCIAERRELPIPPFFNSEPWKMLNHTVLSTSNCGNPSLRLFGFGPVVSDGYGIGYIIKDRSISYSVSSKRRQTQRYVLALDAVLKDMAKILRQKSRTFKAVVRSPSREGTYGDMWGQQQQPKKRDSSDFRAKKTDYRWAKPLLEDIPRQSAGMPPDSYYVDLKSPAEGRNSASAVIAASEAQTSDSQPQKPQRRGFRVSQRKTLSYKQLSESGDALDLATAM